MKNFISILEKRIRITGIKIYEPVGEKVLKITYNFSRNRPESQIFTFETREERDQYLAILDSIL
jgi:hypothetical protein